MVAFGRFDLLFEMVFMKLNLWFLVFSLLSVYYVNLSFNKFRFCISSFHILYFLIRSCFADFLIWEVCFAGPQGEGLLLIRTTPTHQIGGSVSTYNFYLLTFFYRFLSTYISFFEFVSTLIFCNLSQHMKMLNLCQHLNIYEIYESAYE